MVVFPILFIAQGYDNDECNVRINKSMCFVFDLKMPEKALWLTSTLMYKAL